MADYRMFSTSCDLAMLADQHDLEQELQRSTDLASEAAQAAGADIVSHSLIAAQGNLVVTFLLRVTGADMVVGLQTAAAAGTGEAMVATVSPDQPDAVP